ncbi:MAG TPA: hypothetical protein VFN57_05080 [Thermomicrobiaceae bacterium]|nr:hypothetical protein [Thermomicrobiaceae bacterium]
MVGGLPPFAEGRDWIRRASQSRRIDRRVWYDRDDGYEYMRDPNPPRNTWHQIDVRAEQYRDLDPETGEPVAGSEGEWRSLR